MVLLVRHFIAAQQFRHDRRFFILVVVERAVLLRRQLVPRLNALPHRLHLTVLLFEGQLIELVLRFPASGPVRVHDRIHVRILLLHLQVQVLARDVDLFLVFLVGFSLVREPVEGARVAVWRQGCEVLVEFAAVDLLDVDYAESLLLLGLRGLLVFVLAGLLSVS